MSNLSALQQETKHICEKFKVMYEIDPAGSLNIPPGEYVQYQVKSCDKILNINNLLWLYNQRPNRDITIRLSRNNISQYEVMTKIKTNGVRFVYQKYAEQTATDAPLNGHKHYTFLPKRKRNERKINSIIKKDGEFFVNCSGGDYMRSWFNERFPIKVVPKDLHPKLLTPEVKKALRIKPRPKQQGYKLSANYSFVRGADGRYFRAGQEYYQVSRDEMVAMCKAILEDEKEIVVLKGWRRLERGE